MDLARKNNYEVTINQEINGTSMNKPHVVLLGAGASKAALPNGDKNGKQIPLLKDMAKTLDLIDMFPTDLKDIARNDFEKAYSELFGRNDTHLKIIEDKVYNYFNLLKIPDAPNLYDFLILSLRKKDLIATFNWDPFLQQSYFRLRNAGVTNLPEFAFLHGNVLIGICYKCRIKAPPKNTCPKCGKILTPTKLLYPVENKDYSSDPFIQDEWNKLIFYLKECFAITVFGYSIPETDVEAIELLKNGWGKNDTRKIDLTEIIDKPGISENELRKRWKDFIYSSPYNIPKNFYDSFIYNHPRRTGEAHNNQNLGGKFITNNPIPTNFETIDDLVEWFEPLFEGEDYNLYHKTKNNI